MPHSFQTDLLLPKFGPKLNFHLGQGGFERTETLPSINYLGTFSTAKNKISRAIILYNLFNLSPFPPCFYASLDCFSKHMRPWFIQNVFEATPLACDQATRVSHCVNQISKWCEMRQACNNHLTIHFLIFPFWSAPIFLLPNFIDGLARWRRAKAKSAFLLLLFLPDALELPSVLFFSFSLLWSINFSSILLNVYKTASLDWIIWLPLSFFCQILQQFSILKLWPLNLRKGFSS